MLVTTLLITDIYRPCDSDTTPGFLPITRLRNTSWVLFFGCHVNDNDILCCNGATASQSCRRKLIYISHRSSRDLAVFLLQLGEFKIFGVNKFLHQIFSVAVKKST